MNDGKAKMFMYQNWKTCFELLDEDGSKTISRKEFETLGLIFNFSSQAVKSIYREFDVKNEGLDYDQFHLLAIAAIDKQEALERTHNNGNVIWRAVQRVGEWVFGNDDGIDENVFTKR